MSIQYREFPGHVWNLCDFDSGFKQNATSKGARAHAGFGFFKIENKSFDTKVHNQIGKLLLHTHIHRQI